MSDQDTTGSDDQTQADASTPTDAASDASASGYTAPATQADLDRIISDRVNRTKAQFKDYGELRTKAAELDQLKAANQTELERATSEVNRWQTEAESWRQSAMSSRVQALAADFADPTDAVTALSQNNYLDAGGVIDDAAIRRDLDEVLTRKPHWRKPEPAAATAPRLPAANLAQGTSGTAAPSDPREQFAALLRGGLTR